MKYLAVILIPAALYAADFTNNGATLTVDEGVTVIADGSFQNQSGSLTNSGTIQISGDLLNDDNFDSQFGEVVLNGIDQSFTGGVYESLRIESVGVAWMLGDITVNTGFELAGGILDLNGYILTITGSLIHTSGNVTGGGDIIWNSVDIYGCTDPLAQNYSPDAIFDDGSCTYHNGPTWHVSTTGSDITGDGSEENPFRTIQYGIDVTVDGDTVLVQPGNYVENINFSGHNIVVGSLLIMTGETSYISQTVIDGDQFGSVVRFENAEDSSTVISGFTITNGGNVTHGGGIFCEDASPVISHCRITGNNAGNGAGVLCSGSNSRITDLVIMDNHATEDGGGYLDGGSSAVHIHGLMIAYNSAGERGGGICCWTNSQTVIESTTVASNTAGSYGGGIAAGNGADPILNNSIVRGNLPHQIGFWTSHDYNSISISCSDIEGGEEGIANQGNGTVYWLNGNFDADPLFCDPLNDDYSLHAYSPCLPGNHPNGYDCGLIGAFGHGCGALPEPIFTEDFNHSGAMAPGWTTESYSPSRSTPWSPLQDDGDDWSVSALQQQFQEPFEEWLISPIYDLSNYVDLELSFWHDYQHDASEGKVRYSTNGGASWNLLTGYTSTTSGTESFDISPWADEQSNVRLLFMFTGEFMSNASWNIDDFLLSGVFAFDDTPPVASDPVPPQPMEGQWAGLTGTVECTFSDPSSVDAATLQVRIDANGDGDYDDGGAEDWTSVTGFDNGPEIPVTAEVTYLEGLDGMAFEFRAKDLSETNDLYGYSGYGNAEGIEDDWTVNIFYEIDPPEFSDPVPIGQPEPSWVDSRTVTVGCTVNDSCAVDAGSLQMRVDWNQSGDYDDPSEDWAALSGYSLSSEIIVSEEIEFPTDGLFNVEFQATDTLGNGPAYSMGDEGIADDIVVRIDTTPPTTSYLYLQGTSNYTATLLFSPTTDLTFLRYEIYYSLDSLVDVSDALWTDTNDPALGEISTSTTTITGLNYGTPYWFRMRAVDELGHEGDWSNTVHSLTEGTPLAAITDLSLEVVENGLLLTWSEPTEDINGNTPVFIEGYDIHASTDPFFMPMTETRIATITGNSFLHEIVPSGNMLNFYRVVALGCGSTTPYPQFTLVPAGTFMMGSNEGDSNEQPIHQVTLTHSFYLGTLETTNEEFRLALQWAFEQGYVECNGSTVTAFGQDLYDLNDPDCQIGFVEDTFFLEPVHGGAYNGQSSANHPVHSVSWFGAACYCDWRSEMEGLELFYQGEWDQHVTHDPHLAEGYRLPTEAEWEYASQYNDGRAYPWGEVMPNCDYANFRPYPEYCIGGTSPCGHYPLGESQLGIMDLGGNVWEMIADWYASYSVDHQTDPLGPSSGTFRIGRGGVWVSYANNLRCARRLNIWPHATDSNVGFRICRTAIP